MIVGVTNIGAWQCVDIGMWQGGCYYIIPDCGKFRSVPIVTGQLQNESIVTGKLKAEPTVTGQLQNKVIVTGNLKAEPKITGKIDSPICED